MGKRKPPKFTKKTSGSDAKADGVLAGLGIELSKQLPTYDVPIDLIEPSEWNANEMDDGTFNRLVSELDENGFVDPIQIVPGKGGKFRIIGGEHRFHGAVSLGLEKVPCNVLTDKKYMDEKLQKLMSVRLNVIKGKLNPSKFAMLYQEMAKEYGEEQLKALFGFTQNDKWDRLVKGVEKAVESSGIGGKGLADELKKKSKKVKTVDGLGAVLKKLFSKHGSDLKHGYMVFAFGGKEHLYIIADKETTAALSVIQDLCRKKNLNINEVIAPAIKAIPESISESDNE